jgi:hypothetical protein
MGRRSSINVGDVIGNFTILEVIPSEKPGKHSRGKVKCAICDGIKEMYSFNIRRRYSCGCSQRDISTWKSKGPKNMPWKLPHGEASKNDLYSSYRSSAKKRGLNFDIDLEYFSENVIKSCHYCGDFLTSVKKSQSKTGGDFYYTGIDRVDSSKGYSEDNCVPCCKTCNIMKWELSTENFTTHILKISSHLNSK